jgi:hypothetical protein
MLCIVKYENGVGLSNNELAFIRCDGDRYGYTFSDGREHSGSLSQFVACAVHVDNKDILEKRIFHAVFARDIQPLEQVMQGMSEADAAVRVRESNMTPPMRDNDKDLTFLRTCFAGVCQMQEHLRHRVLPGVVAEEEDVCCRIAAEPGPTL